MPKLAYRYWLPGVLLTVAIVATVLLTGGSDIRPITVVEPVTGSAR
jgi:hypothetical protein